MNFSIISSTSYCLLNYTICSDTTIGSTIISIGLGVFVPLENVSLILETSPLLVKGYNFRPFDTAQPLIRVISEDP